MEAINQVAVAVIMAWAFWLMLSSKEDEGVAGSIVYLLVILAGLGVLSAQGQISEIKFNCALAIVGIRRFWLSVCWPALREFLRRHHGNHPTP